MTRPRPGIGSELLPLGLILACLAGSLISVVSMHRRGAVPRNASVPPPPTPVVVAPPPVPEAAAPLPPPPPAPPPSPRPPQEDPTKKALARLRAAEAEERRETEAADRRARALEAARQSALAESQRWRRREALVHAQAEGLSEEARKLEQEADALALERDVLAQERDSARAALAKARSSMSYAVLPHKGPNGTWRKPIIIECRDGTAQLQPNGPTFSLLDIAGLIGMRSSPLVVAVARELIRLEGTPSPDGAPVVPYIFFVIRPDGIRPYYAARARLEPLGIAFGYELVDQDWEIDFSDPDDPADGGKGIPAPPARGPAVADPGGGGFTWPGERPSPRGPTPDNEPADTFVWPARPAGRVGGLGISEPAGRGSGPGPRPSTGSGNGGGGVPSGIDLAGDPGRRPFPGGSGTGGSEGPGLGGTGGSGGPGLGGTGGIGGEGVGRPGPVEPGGIGADGTGSGPIGRSHGHPGPLADQTGGLGGSRSRSATERAFGQRAGLVPLTSGGLPHLEAAGSGDGTRGGASATPGARPPGDSSDRLAGAGSGNPGSAPQGSRPDAQGSVGGAGMGLDGPPRDATGGGSGSPGAPPQTRTPILPLDLTSDGGSGSSSGDSGGSEPHAKTGTRVGSRSRYERPKKVEVPFEIVVACGPNGAVIQPGGYRLSTKSIKEKGLVAKELEAIIQLRKQVDPLIVPRPSIRFLVEPGGSDTYWEARRQTVLSGLNWPMSLQLGDTSLMGFTPRETWR